MISYSEESFEEVWPLIQKFMEDQWKEVGSLQERSLDVDVDMFMQSQNDGGLVCCVARAEDDIVGYVVDFIRYHPHYKDVKVSVCDSHYITEKYRARCAVGLTRFVEKVEREMGVYVRTTRSKRTNRAGDFFKAIGYDEAEVAWIKRL